MYLLLNLNVVSNLIIKYLPISLIKINYKIENFSVIGSTTYQILCTSVKYFFSYSADRQTEVVVGFVGIRNKSTATEI